MRFGPFSLSGLWTVGATWSAVTFRTSAGGGERVTCGFSSCRWAVLGGMFVFVAAGGPVLRRLSFDALAGVLGGGQDERGGGVGVAALGIRQDTGGSGTARQAGTMFYKIPGHRLEQRSSFVPESGPQLPFRNYGRAMSSGTPLIWRVTAPRLPSLHA